MKKKLALVQAEIVVMKKVLFTDGGSVVCRPETAWEFAQHEDYLSTEDATKKEIKEYEKHQEFQKYVDKYLTLIEDFNSERPNADERFRYDRHDMLNLVVMLVKKEKPQIKQDKK